MRLLAGAINTDFAVTYNCAPISAKRPTIPSKNLFYLQPVDYSMEWNLFPFDLRVVGQQSMVEPTETGNPNV
jgi:hypothetical protein